MDIYFSTIQYAMYEEDEEFVGIAQIKLPSLEYLTQDITGAGIAGQITAPLIGQMNSMEIEIQMLTLSPQAVKLAEPRMHTWEFRELQQCARPGNGTQGVSTVKHVIRAFPSGMDGGTLSPNSASNPNITAQVYYWKQYRNGQSVLELDPLNYICNVNGVDYLETVRSGLGK